MKKIILLLITLLMLTCFSSAVTLKKTIGTVSMTSDIPAGRQITLRYVQDTGNFVKWIVTTGNVTLEDPTSTTITFTMPNEAVEIVADDGSTYNLTVSVDGNVVETTEREIGEEVTVTATESRESKFEKWEITGLTGVEATTNPLTFTMPSSDVEIIAKFYTVIYEYVDGDKHIAHYTYSSGETESIEETHSLVENVCSGCGNIIQTSFTWDTTDTLTKSIIVATNAETKIDWGDGVVEEVSQNSSDTTYSHIYEEEGSYTVEIWGNVITTLNCNKMNISDLDVSKNTALKKLYCYNTNINELDVSKNTALGTLQCYSTSISDLDISNNTSLTTLYCHNTNISNLDLSTNIKLNLFSCYGTDVSELDLTNNIKLSTLQCQNTSISDLDISNNTALTTLYCQNTNISELDLTNNTSLTRLYCQNTNISELDLTNNTALTTLKCSNTNITTLDLTNNTALTSLSCDDDVTVIGYSN